MYAIASKKEIFDFILKNENTGIQLRERMTR